MPNYFDNQKRGWEWRVTDNKAEVTTDHGTHTHTLDLSSITIGEMSENTGKTMGEAHRNTTHDYKTTEETNTPDSSSKGGKNMERNSFVESLKADKATIDRCTEVSREAARNAQNQSGKKSGLDNGGRERGDDSSAPGHTGRESGNKSGTQSNSHSTTGDGHGSNGSSSGHSSSGQGAGGHGAGGQGSGGIGVGGHGGTGGH